jgi:two-component SAPR family response regulator
MGGYGFHTYSGLLQKYTEEKKEWEQFDLSKSITPRYLGSFGIWKDSVFLYFGGYGNESGDQREFPQNYYDLYAIDIKDFSVKKIWELENIKSYFTNGNSLIVNENKQTFYTLCYPNKKYETHIMLHEYAINSPEFQILGDSIPYLFNDVESYCDLMKPEDQSQLIALTVTRKNNDSEVNIYTIDYPPLSLSETQQIPPAKANKGFLTAVISISVVLLIFIWFIFRKRKTNKQTVFTIPELNQYDTTPSVLSENTSQQDKFPSIGLLGQFKVLDQEGNNITNGFTPTTRQIFLLILLSSIRNKQGISSSELRNVLWYDKDEESARNNRNVYINKLRILLKNVGYISILSNKSYWRITLDNNVFCDYERVLSLIAALEKNPIPDKFLLNEMLDIAGKGKLLPFYEMEWLDNIKADYSNRIIEFLQKKARLPELKDELALLLKISEVILLHDDIEEIGIQLKCNTLFRLDKKKQALVSFNKFSEEHVKLLGIETKLSFEDIVK